MDRHHIITPLVVDTRENLTHEIPPTFVCVDAEEKRTLKGGGGGAIEKKLFMGFDKDLLRGETGNVGLFHGAPHVFQVFVAHHRGVVMVEVVGGFDGGEDGGSEYRTVDCVLNRRKHQTADFNGNGCGVAQDPVRFF
jgi:hypothetical protein